MPLRVMGMCFAIRVVRKSDSHNGGQDALEERCVMQQLYVRALAPDTKSLSLLLRRHHPNRQVRNRLHLRTLPWTVVPGTSLGLALHLSDGIDTRICHRLVMILEVQSDGRVHDEIA